MGRDDDDDDDDDEPTGIESGVIDILLSWSSPCETRTEKRNLSRKINSKGDHFNNLN